MSSNQWQSAEDGGPFLFIQALLRTSTIPTYLRDDWYRDWGSIERYDRLVPADEAPDAVIDQGIDESARLEPRRTDQGAAMTANAHRRALATDRSASAERQSNAACRVRPLGARRSQG